MSKIKDLNKIINEPEEYANSLTIPKLVSILQKLSDAYYGETKPLIDDEHYDIMFDVLKERDPNNAFLFQTGMKKTTNKDINLPYSMPSLNKIKVDDKILTRWFNTYPGNYCIMDKLDGISVQIYKDKNGNIDIFTKKQTNIGTSKKHLLKYLVSDKVL
jgi:NAD-dependent DNA ligase